MCPAPGPAVLLRLSATVLLILAGGAVPALGVKIGDITHLQGARTNKLLGMGLVIGLNGTGDGGKFAPSIRALAQLHARFANPVAGAEELKNVKNIAIVNIEVTLPENGVREGERVDVYVSAPAAKSLAGGRLLLAPLVGPHPDDPRIMAMASGPVQIEDATRPNTGRIAQGATLEQDWIHNFVASGQELSVFRSAAPGRVPHWVNPDDAYVTLVTDEAHSEWSIVYAIAQTINEEAAIPSADGTQSPPLAMACDPRTVVIRVPPAELANLAQFLGRIENLALSMPDSEARVVIKRTAGLIVVTGDVEISPVVITYKGLTITTMVPEPAPTPENPKLIEKEFVALDPSRKGGTRLADLVDALNQLRVPAADKISIVEQLHKTGKLHARLIVEN